MELFDSWITLWLVLLALFLVIEAVTLGLTTIWCAGGALPALVLAVFGIHPGIQLGVFVGVSLLLFFFTRPIAVKFFNKNRLKTNVEAMIDKQGIVIVEIDNLAGTGRVQVEGSEWLARNYIDDGLIPSGTVVIVRAVSGNKLMVERSAERSG